LWDSNLNGICPLKKFDNSRNFARAWWDARALAYEPPQQRKRKGCKVQDKQSMLKQASEYLYRILSPKSPNSFA